FLSLEWITVDLRCSSIPNDLLKAYYEKWYCFVSRTSNFILNCRPYTDMVPDVTPPVNLLSAYELDLYERHLFPHPTITGVKSPFDAYQTYINMSEQPKSGLRRKNLRPYLNLGSRRSAKVHKRTSNQDDTEQLSTRNSKVSAVQFSPVRTSDPVISVYRLLIRPAILEMKEGGITARLRYIIQLHKRITGYYRLIIEVRLSPEFPPIFVGEMKDVCAHWPANVPQSQCSVRRSRLYQKGQMCLCYMPPGLYHQRLRFNMRRILDDLEIPRYLVSVLFQG
ncbi:hypothetical protein X801_01385, partial [Opisthorchis viverrini]